MSFNTAQHAVDTITRQYDDLTDQGVTHLAALDFIALEHGVPRHKLAAIINDRDAGLHGTSGETTTAAVANDAPKRRSFLARVQSHPAVVEARQAEATIAGLDKPAHGGYPGVVDPGTVTCPDAPPEWL